MTPPVRPHVRGFMKHDKVERLTLIYSPSKMKLRDSIIHVREARKFKRLSLYGSEV